MPHAAAFKLGTKISQVKVQHYVPQFLLRNFTSDKKDRVHVFDKQKGTTFFTHVKNVASESRFYDFEVESEGRSLEGSLSKLESDTRPIIDRIVKEESIASLDSAERRILSVFFAVQLTRTRAHRELWLSLPALLAERLKDEKIADNEFMRSVLSQPSDKEAAAETAPMIANAAVELAPHFEDKAWLLFSTNKHRPYYIGDHPIAKTNAEKQDLRGNLGLTSKGIELYCPLSSTLCLGMLCPTIADLFKKQKAALSRMDPKQRSTIQRAGEREAVAEAFDSGLPVSQSALQVRQTNSLQVISSERYVFCKAEEFDLVKEMIASNKAFMRSQRFTINWV